MSLSLITREKSGCLMSKKQLDYKEKECNARKAIRLQGFYIFIVS